jgi:hypothetical protein
MSGGLMFTKVECGCVYQTFRDHFGRYDEESIERFIICKSCMKKEKDLTDQEVIEKTNQVITLLIEELKAEDGGDQWFAADGCSSLCF